MMLQTKVTEVQKTHTTHKYTGSVLKFSQNKTMTEKTNENAHEIPQSQTIGQPTISRGRDIYPLRASQQQEYNLSKATSSLFLSVRNCKI